MKIDHKQIEAASLEREAVLRWLDETNKAIQSQWKHGAVSNEIALFWLDKASELQALLLSRRMQQETKVTA